ncbi:MAG: LPXTG cell wall anchor domain-containing protein [Ilumatobacteraceae bacterium]
MHSPTVRTRRLAIATIGLGVIGTLSPATPTSAIDATPHPAVTATSGCEGDLFFIHTTVSNDGGGVVAHFVVTAVDVKGPITIDEPLDVYPNDVQVDDWQLFEGVPGSVHITSTNADPVVDFFLQVTPDCVSDVTMPVDSVPVDTAVDSGAGAGSSGGGLPSTGSSSPATMLIAAALLLAGAWLVRVVRRPA